MISKVDDLENKLREKDDIINDLTEKVHSLPENEDEKNQGDVHEVSENEN